MVNGGYWRLLMANSELMVIYMNTHNIPSGYD